MWSERVAICFVDSLHIQEKGHPIKRKWYGYVSRHERRHCPFKCIKNNSR